MSGGLSNIQIDQKLKHITNYRGCFMRDELPPLPKAGFYVLNLEPHTRDGSHWVCLALSKKECLYFDSFGCLPPQEVIEFFKKSGLPAYYSITQIQDITSQDCGYFCIYVIKQLNAGRCIENILLDFHLGKHLLENDSIVEVTNKRKMTKINN